MLNAQLSWLLAFLVAARWIVLTTLCLPLFEILPTFRLTRWKMMNAKRWLCSSWVPRWDGESVFASHARSRGDGLQTTPDKRCTSFCLIVVLYLPTARLSWKLYSGGLRMVVFPKRCAVRTVAISLLSRRCWRLKYVYIWKWRFGGVCNQRADPNWFALTSLTTAE